MHRAGVVGEKQRAFAQLGRELIERRFADAIQTVRAQRRFNRGASFPIGRRAEEDPLHGTLLRDGESDFGETFREPAFRRAVFRAGTQSEFRRRAVGFDAGQKFSHFRWRLWSADLARHAKITINLVLNGTASRFLGHDLVQQPAATVSRKTDAARDAGEPDFECRAKRVRKKDGDIEPRLATDRVDGGENFLRINRQHLIHLRDELPNGGDFFRSGDRDVSIGPAGLDRAHRGHADDAVPKPIRSADQNPERLERRSRWHVDPALVICEEKIRLRRFPAVVHPKPILGRLPNFLLDHFIRFEGD